MEVEEIKQLIEAVSESKLEELDYEENGVKLHLSKRPKHHGKGPMPPAPGPMPPAPGPMPPAPGWRPPQPGACPPPGQGPQDEAAAWKGDKNEPS